MIQVPYLDGLENVSEHRALLSLVRLGPVLVAVGCQAVQLVTQLVPVVKLEVLEEQTQVTMHSRPTKQNQEACA